jgi:hypothetical protein
MIDGGSFENVGVAKIHRVAPGQEVIPDPAELSMMHQSAL